VSQQIAAAPKGAHVVKAFNSIFSGVLAEDKPLDVSTPATAPRRKHVSRRFWRAWTCGPSTQEGRPRLIDSTRSVSRIGTKRKCLPTTTSPTSTQSPTSSTAALDRHSDSRHHRKRVVGRTHAQRPTVEHSTRAVNAYLVKFNIEMTSMREIAATDAGDCADP
jgi:hypothetical protein